MTFLAILMFLTGLYLTTIKIGTDNDGDYAISRRTKEESWLGKWIMVGSLPFFFFTTVFFFPNAGTNYTIQKKFQDKKYTIHNKSGLTYRGFCTMIPMDNELVVKNLTPSHYKDWKDGTRKEAEATYVVQSNGGSFNDKIGVWFETTTIIDCNPSHENYTKIVLNGMSEENIVRQRILPFINEVQGITAKLFGTEEYIEGAKAIASEMYYDQLQYGKYAIVEVENSSASTSPVDSVQNRLVSSNNKTQSRYEIKKDANGKPIRIGEGLKIYGFNVRQAMIEDEEMHEDFEAMMKDVRKIEGENQKLRQQAEKALRQQEFNRNDGEAKKIAEQKLQEKEQITKVVQAKTAAEEAKYFLETQERILAAEKIATQVAEEKKKQNVAARAGGIDPLVLKKLELQNNIDVMNAIFGGKALANLQTNISGSGSGGQDGVQTLLNWVLTQQASN